MSSSSDYWVRYTTTTHSPLTTHFNMPTSSKIRQAEGRIYSLFLEPKQNIKIRFHPDSASEEIELPDPYRRGQQKASQKKRRGRIEEYDLDEGRMSSRSVVYLPTTSSLGQLH